MGHFLSILEILRFILLVIFVHDRLLKFNLGLARPCIPFFQPSVGVLVHQHREFGEPLESFLLETYGRLEVLVFDAAVLLPKR